MLRDEFSAIRVVANSDNKGYASAANQCLKVVQGRYVCMLNPDAYVFPDTLTAMLHLMDTRPDIGVASCLTQDGEGNTCPTARHGPNVFNALLHAFAIPVLLPSEAFVRKYMGWFLGRYFFQYKTQLRDCEPFYLDGGFLVLRREILQQVGLMDENLFLDGEDYDWCLRMKRAGWKVFFTTQTRVVHGMHASKESCRDAMFVQWFKSYLYLTRKNRGAFSYQIQRAGTIAGMLTRLLAACLKAPFVDFVRTRASAGRYLLTIRMCIEFRPLDCLKGMHEQQQRARMLGWQ
jgi:GT2 family glycosyltransferase